MTIRSYLDRFVHPWIAAIATVGALLWLASFIVAAIGLGIRTSHPLWNIRLFAASGYLGLLGMGIIAACALWLGGLRIVQVTRRFVG
ncbi:hypothetical protein [Halococcus hamelinensis]|jgi:hypothetical protein|uniref:Uncharacterized protein n=1 Tax=Halococcus hamelinensis 100A6 TaxID=1132509 RepID=M0LT31_9EURY|nr:hypothetical protein [Halococcus hamelinensis]EMA36722.1 hypothetical protein C447_13984 [Halococcus hamelinensis 100A6]